MKRSWVLGFAAVIGLMVIGWSLKKVQSSQVAAGLSFQGKSIEAWADLGVGASMARPQDLATARLASNAIHQIGGPAVGWIEAMMPKHTDLLLQIGSHIPLPDSIHAPITDGAIQDVRRALFILYALDGATIPYVCEVSTNWVLTPSYIAAVLGPASLPVVIPALTNDTSGEIKNGLLTSIAHWGFNARRAGPLLWERWERNTIPADAGRWLFALASTGYRADELASRVLVRLTNAPSGGAECRTNLSLLSVMGRPGAEALLSLLHHPDRTMQHDAFGALFLVRRPASQMRGIPTIGGSTGGQSANVLVHRLPEWSWVSLERAPVADRVRAAELAMERRFHPERFAASERSDLDSLLRLLRSDPDPAVSRIAANALDGAVVFPGR